jgi:hypothetical protein
MFEVREIKAAEDHILELAFACGTYATLTEWKFRFPGSLNNEGERQRIDQVGHTSELMCLGGDATRTTLDMSAESV